MQKNLENSFKQIRKRKDDHSYDGLIEEVRKSFFNHLALLPEEMLYDIFTHFLESYTDGKDTYGDFDRLGEKLLDTADLLSGEYDAEKSTLTVGELEFIKDSANDFAGDLDDEILFYIMQTAVDRGVFH